MPQSPVGRRSSSAGGLLSYRDDLVSHRSDDGAASSPPRPFSATSGSLAAVRHAVKQTSGIAAAYAAYVALGGALLASGYEAGTARPFLSFGAALVPIVLLARAWAAAGASHAAARRARASLCGLGAVAAAFLVLETVDVTFLEGMGL